MTCFENSIVILFTAISGLPQSLRQAYESSVIANLDFFICLRRAYAKLTSQAHLQNGSFREASGNLTSQAGLCTTQKSNCLRQPYANLPSQAGSSAPWPARRHPPHFGIFRLRDAYVMLTGCLREFSAAAILAKSILKSN